MEVEYLCSLRLRAKGNTKAFFGLGPYRLLEEIEKTKSLRLAAMKMGMAYSKAWGLIKQAQKQLGDDLVCSTTGGAGGGSTVLTEKGLQLVTAYRSAQADIKDYVYQVAAKHFGDVL